MSSGEAAAKERARRRAARETGDEFEGKEEKQKGVLSHLGNTNREKDEGAGRTATIDDDAAAETFFDEFSSFLPGAGPTGGSNDVFFSQLNLSRPLMRGVESMGFVRPTPIQARVVPIAMAGRDVCGSAVTGSGKVSAAERLLWTEGIAVRTPRPRNQFAAEGGRGRQGVAA